MKRGLKDAFVLRGYPGDHSPIYPENKLSSRDMLEALAAATKRKND
jgi:hypothetical protein